MEKKRFIQCALCGARNIDHPKRGFFRFPVNERGKEWAEYTGLLHLMNKPASQLKHHRLCSEHFKEEDVYSCSTRKYLRPFSVPSMPLSRPLIERVLHKRTYDAFKRGTLHDCKDTSLGTPVDNNKYWQKTESSPEDCEHVQELAVTNVFTLGTVTWSSNDSSSLTSSENNDCVSGKTLADAFIKGTFSKLTEGVSSDRKGGGNQEDMSLADVYAIEAVSLKEDEAAASFLPENIKFVCLQEVSDVTTVDVETPSVNCVSGGSTLTILVQDIAAPGFTTSNLAKQNRPTSEARTTKRNFVKCLQRKLRRTRRSVRNSAKVLRTARMKRMSNTFSNTLTDFAELLVADDDGGSNNRHQRRSLSTKDNSLALGIYLNSPNVYKVLQRRLHLPKTKMLGRLLYSVGQDVGFCPQIFSALSIVAKRMRVKDRCCILSFDTVSISPGLFYNKRTDRINGFEDFGSSIQLRKRMAKKALVFMASGVCRPWKQVIGYFFTHSSTNVGVLKHLVVSGIEYLSSAGMRVVAVVCDPVPSNRALYKSLNCAPEKPFFQVNSNVVYAIFDAPCLLRRLRNCFFKYNVVFPESCTKENDGTNRCCAKWQAVVDLRSREHRSVVKLTKWHVAPAMCRQTSLRLASQVFSQSVAGALWTHALYTNDRVARDTADFCSEIYEMFDSVNGCASNDGSKTKELLNPVNVGSPHVDVWMKKCGFLDSLVFRDGNEKIIPPPCVHSWQLTLSALIGLWSYLQHLGVQQMLPGRCNLNFLKDSLVLIRNQRSSYKWKRLTMVQFQHAIKRVMAKHMMTPHFTSKNYQIDILSLLLDDSLYNRAELQEFFRYCPLPNVESVPVEVSQALAVVHNEECTLDETSTTNTLIAGYLILMARRNDFCDKCIEKLVSTETCLSDMLSKHDHLKNEFVMPCNEFVDIVRLMGIEFDKYFPLIFSQNCLSENLYIIINEKVHFNRVLQFHDDHYKSLKTFVVKLYVLVMIINKLKWER